jgi:hypothetical protein
LPQWLLQMTMTTFQIVSKLAASCISSTNNPFSRETALHTLCRTWPRLLPTYLLPFCASHVFSTVHRVSTTARPPAPPFFPQDCCSHLPQGFPCQAAQRFGAPNLALASNRLGYHPLPLQLFEICRLLLHCTSFLIQTEETSVARPKNLFLHVRFNGRLHAHHNF